MPSIVTTIFRKTLSSACFIIPALCFSAFAGKDIADRSASRSKFGTETLQKPGADEVDKQEKAWIADVLKQDKANKAAWDAEVKAAQAAHKPVPIETVAKRDYYNHHIMVMMLEDGLIGKVKGSIQNLSFSLTKQGEFIVNGVKQPEATYQRYLKSLHAPIPGPIIYSYSITTTNTKSIAAQTDREKIQTIRENNKLSDSEKKNLVRTALINDLLKDRLIKDSRKISFRLTDEKFTINKIVQPAAIHRKYSNIYLTGKLMLWAYSREGDANNNKSSEAFGEKPVYK